MTTIMPVPGETPTCWTCRAEIARGDAVVIGATCTGTAVILHAACAEAPAVPK